MSIAVPNTILQVEDCEDDAFLLKRRFEKLGAPQTIITLTDGEEAVRYLKGEGIYADRNRFPMPWLLLLDLKLPKLHGYEVLAWCRSRQETKALRVVVVNDGTDLREIERAHVLGADGFLSKPPTEAQVRDLIRKRAGRWSPIREPQRTIAPSPCMQAGARI
jgi:CheY-like chemotaxis protein